MVGLRAAEVVLLVPTNIPSLLVDREGKHLAAMPDAPVTRIAELRLLTHRITGVHPLIIGLVERGLVVPRRVRREIAFVLRQVYFDGPCRARHPFIGENVTTHAAVCLLFHQIIDRRARRGCMTDDTKVELDAARRPRPAHRNIPELRHAIVIHKLLTGGLVYRAPDFTTHLREKRQTDVIVLQHHRLPLLLDAFRRKAVEAEVGIIQIRWCSHRIRVRERIARHHARLLLYGSLLRPHRVRQTSHAIGNNQYSFHGNFIYLRFVSSFFRETLPTR